MSYSELLRDPRWQKVRLHVFKRDKWRCRLCKHKNGKHKRNLQVHHLKYTAEFKEPWNEPKVNLHTLCNVCHAFAEFLKKLKLGYPNKIKMLPGAIKDMPILISYYKNDGVSFYEVNKVPAGYEFHFRIAFHKKTFNKIVKFYPKNGR